MLNKFHYNNNNNLLYVEYDNSLVTIRTDGRRIALDTINSFCKIGNSKYLISCDFDTNIIEDILNVEVKLKIAIEELTNLALNDNNSFIPKEYKDIKIVDTDYIVEKEDFNKFVNISIGSDWFVEYNGIKYPRDKSKWNKSMLHQQLEKYLGNFEFSSTSSYCDIKNLQDGFELVKHWHTLDIINDNDIVEFKHLEFVYDKSNYPNHLNLYLTPLQIQRVYKNGVINMEELDLVWCEYFDVYEDLWSEYDKHGYRTRNIRINY